MANLKCVTTRNHFRMSVLLGVLFLVVGVSLFIHLISVIPDNGRLANSAEWMLEQIWHYDGSISWWNSISITLFLPLTAVFMTISGVILVSQQLLAMLRHKSVL